MNIIAYERKLFLLDHLCDELTISKTIDRFEKVDKAEDEELVLGVTANVHGDRSPAPVFIFSILDIVAYFGAANLVKFSDNCLKNFSRSSTSY